MRYALVQKMVKRVIAIFPFIDILKLPESPHQFVTLGLHTGCRKQELLGLEWGRVDLQKNLIRLDAEHTKSAKRRSVPLNRLARSAILNRARYRAQHCPDSLWVFAHPDGSRIGDVKKRVCVGLQTCRDP